MKHDNRLAIIRPTGYPIARNLYNCQEIGLARGLSLCGVHTDVYVAGIGSKVEFHDIEAVGSGNVRLIEMPFFKIPEIDQAFYPKLRRLLREGTYDIIQVNEESELTSFLVAHFARGLGIPTVVYQGMYKQITGRLRSAFQHCYDRVLLPVFRRNIDMALAKTSRAQKHLKRKGFEKTMVIPVGLDPTPFVASKERAWRNDFCIPDHSPIILYVGIFERRRNVDFMLNLAKRLFDEGITLVMAGAGPEFGRISARVREENLSNVRLVGIVEQQDLPSLYRESSLFLLPSNYEIYGMVVLEAMYFGVPVISTRTAGPEDIIVQGVDGILMAGLDEKEWSGAILNILHQPEKLLCMGQASEEKVRKSLTWEAVARKYVTNVIEPLSFSVRNSTC